MDKQKKKGTRKEIVEIISYKSPRTDEEIKSFVDRTLDALLETLLKYKTVELRNFGVFKIKKRKEMKRVNPKTQETIDVPEKYIVKFYPGKEMRERTTELADITELQALKTER